VQGLLGRHLGHAGLPYLWVVDDLPPELGEEGLNPWLAPNALGRTLITTRAKRFNHLASIDLPQLDADEALRLLARGKPAGAADEPVAREICGALGHHSLAIDVAAALVQRRGYAGFLVSLRRDDRDALELAATGFSEALPNGHERSIASTLLASIRELGEPARDVLRIASLLAAAPIPRDLIWRSIARVDELDGEDAQDRCDPATDELLNSSLADDTDGDAITVHTLVSRTQHFRDLQAERLTALRASVIATLNEEMQRAADIREHELLTHWVPHAREVSRSPQDAEAASLAGWVARLDLERGQYTLAAAGYRAELEARQRVRGPEHPDTLASMNNLASTLSAQGDLQGARALEEKVLEASQRVLGQEHPDTLASMNNLASTLSAQGDLHGARALQEQALEARQRVLAGPK
jgi:tetratricopeptide (TPR) repeat protein